MTISDEIFIIANKLANEGLSPSVALIKSKLRQPIPLPQLISIFKQWQHEPDFIDIEDNQKIEKPKDHTIDANEELSQAIQAAIQPLQTDIQNLTTLVQELLSKQKDH